MERSVLFVTSGIWLLERTVLTRPIIAKEGPLSSFALVSLESENCGGMLAKNRPCLEDRHTLGSPALDYRTRRHREFGSLLPALQRLGPAFLVLRLTCSVRASRVGEGPGTRATPSYERALRPFRLGRCLLLARRGCLLRNALPEEIGQLRIDLVRVGPSDRMRSILYDH